ncbi:GNAT family N-acetyltransferase [Labrenzia sp. R4_2]|uniref:GNAT family N-acetyltransferase n=1 Tax=Labrenzia sp. R4_2 TaxID=2821107 RepID=UPI001ADD2742|nr:GNAT family N-acetyltransferase [Labrenzia sp. R4_2]MBO9421177.1 GNAT family N-acetyltransferase [Labrenzia sp. R4_2]
MKIRQTRKSDISVLQAVEISASRAFLEIEGLETFADGSCATEEQHLSAIEPGTSWTAETNNGQQVGFLAAIPENDALHVYEISVHSDYQKKGIGKALTEHAEAHARALGLSEMTLTTFRNVPWNAPFYERLGFQILKLKECDARLGSILAEELGRGLPLPEQRCAMRKTLT